jgi:hypothetical protein
MAGLLNIFDPGYYGGPMQGLLANLPGYQAQPGPPQGFPGMPTDMSGQSRAPMQIAPQEQPQQTPEVMPQQMPQAPQPGFMERLGAGLGANSNTMLAMGASLLGGQGFGGAANAAMAGRQLDQKQASANMTEAALVKQGLTPDLAKVVAGNPALMSAVMQHRLGLGKGNQTNDIQEYQYAKQHDGFKGSFQDWIANKRAGAGEFGMTPIWGVGADGKPAVMQLGKGGVATQSQLPDGFTIARDPIKIEGPTGTTLLEAQTRQVIGFIPKDNARASADKARGEIEGQSQGELPAAEMTASRTIKQIDEFAKSEGFNEVFGALDQFRPNWTMSDKGRDALTKFKQLSGRAFLEGRSMLKGGGAITDFESNKAEMAIARLERSLSEDDAKAALEEFKDAVREGAAKLRAKAAGGATPAAVPAPAGAPNLKQKYGLE